MNIVKYNQFSIFAWAIRRFLQGIETPNELRTNSSPASNKNVIQTSYQINDAT